MTRWGWLALASAGAGWRGPVAIILLACARGWRRRTRSSRTTRDHDIDELAALVVIGLSASLTLAGALQSASEELGDPVEHEIADLLRRARTRGLARALAETDGPLAALAGQLARAHVSGAPMVGAVTAFLETRRSTVRAALMESARTLPVRLVIPVATLLLPGFVVLLMGPFVLDQLTGLAVPLSP